MYVYIAMCVCVCRGGGGREKLGWVQIDKDTLTDTGEEDKGGGTQADRKLL